MTRAGGLEEVVLCGFGKLQKKINLKRWRSREGAAREIPIKEIKTRPRVISHLLGCIS